jgi:multiple sugar transport system substrate-binding protein
MKEISHGRAGRLAVSRRTLMAGGAAAGALAALGPLGARAQERGTVRFGIFGNASKLEIRGESVARYAELNPDVEVIYEGVPSDAWPDKIAAMVAGGTAPDVITLSIGDMEQFASRGALAELDPYVPSPFRAELFSEAVLDLGRFDGKIYGIPIAVSIQGLGYNQSALERLGMDAPPNDWGYEEYAAYCAAIHQADPSLYGSHDFGARLETFQMYLLAQGKQLYNGQELAVTTEDVAEWLNLWNEMRKTGAAVPADLQAQFTGTEWPNSPLVRGTAVFAQMASQDLAGGYQALTSDTLGMMMPPAPKAGENPGLYPRPTSSLTLNARSENPEEAVKLMDWFVSDPESAKILGLISGPPASKPALAAVLELQDLSEVDQKVLTYAQAALAEALPAPPAQRGDRAMTDLMRRINENVGFGQSTVQEAAEEFVTQANATLRRA